LPKECLLPRHVSDVQLYCSGLYRDLGDVGDVFQACKQNQSVLVRPTSLTIPGVFATLHQIAGEKGGGERSQALLTLEKGGLTGGHRFTTLFLCSATARHLQCQ
jgi:hypothetical protein